jgi:hypothetical protein
MSINPLNVFPILTHCINSSSKNANKLIDGVHQVAWNFYVALKIHPNFFQLVFIDFDHFTIRKSFIFKTLQHGQ